MKTYLELTNELAELDRKYPKYSERKDIEKTKLIVSYNKERKGVKSNELHNL